MRLKDIIKLLKIHKYYYHEELGELWVIEHYPEYVIKSFLNTLDNEQVHAYAEIYHQATMLLKTLNIEDLKVKPILFTGEDFLVREKITLSVPINESRLDEEDLEMVNEISNSVQNGLKKIQKNDKLQYVFLVDLLCKNLKQKYGGLHWDPLGLKLIVTDLKISVDDIESFRKIEKSC